MNKAKVQVRAVDNGFIVKVLNHGLSPLKEPYDGYKGEAVFHSIEEVTEYLRVTFNVLDKVK